VTERQRRKGAQLLNNLTETTYSWQMEKALDRTLWRTAFGSPVASSQDTTDGLPNITSAAQTTQPLAVQFSAPLVTCHLSLTDPHIFTALF
jgi:hypothetical protein